MLVCQLIYAFQREEPVLAESGVELILQKLDELFSEHCHILCLAFQISVLIDTLKTALSRHVCALKNEDTSLTQKQICLKILHAVRHSCYQGWVAGQCVQDVVGEHSHLTGKFLDFADLLAHHEPDIMQGERDIAAGLVAEQEERGKAAQVVESYPREQKPVRKKPKQSFAKPKAGKWADPVAQQERRQEKLSPSQQKYIDAVQNITAHPEDAIRKLTTLMKVMRGNPQIMCQCQMAMADALMLQVHPIVSQCKKSRQAVIRYQTCLDEVVKAETLEYPNRAIYKKFLGALEHLPDQLTELSGKIRLWKHYSALVDKKRAGSMVEKIQGAETVDQQYIDTVIAELKVFLSLLKNTIEKRRHMLESHRRSKIFVADYENSKAVQDALCIHKVYKVSLRLDSMLKQSLTK